MPGYPPIEKHRSNHTRPDHSHSDSIESGVPPRYRWVPKKWSNCPNCIPAQERLMFACETHRADSALLPCPPCCSKVHSLLSSCLAIYAPTQEYSSFRAHNSHAYSRFCSSEFLHLRFHTKEPPFASNRTNCGPAPEWRRFQYIHSNHKCLYLGIVIP